MTAFGRQPIRKGVIEFRRPAEKFADVPNGNFQAAAAQPATT